MDKRKNPFYQHADAEFFIAERNGSVVGRIGAIVNHNHNSEHKESAGFFGFFESVNDREVSTALFDAAADFVRSKGATIFRGPASPSVNDEFGLLVEGFDKTPAILMTYNHPYYAELIEAYGFRKAKDLFAYKLSQKTVYSEKLERANEIVKKRYDMVFRPMNMKRFKEDVERVKAVYNKAWANNWGAVPMTDAEIDALATDLKPIVVPDLVIFAERAGETIGFALSVPDIHQALRFNKSGGLLAGLWHLYSKKRHIDTVRIIVLGVLPEHQHTGAAGVLFYETAVRARKLGYAFGEASWVLEDNGPMNRAAVLMNGIVEKRYRLYERPLASTTIQS
jgi:GNAT superfamily N-acetyltransferase